MMGTETRYYLTDDCDLDDPMEMRLSQGENGDWYLSICPQGDRFTRHCVRITTSGSGYPGAAKAVADLFRATPLRGPEAQRHMAPVTAVPEEEETP
jgi:hypothetical protein